MAIKYLKKAIKTPSTDDHKTREAVQNILNDIEKRKEDGCIELTKKFDKYNGDIYYDLAKMKHNLTVNHDILDKELYNIDIDGKDINVDILRSNEKCECVKVLEDFVNENGLDNKKVDIIKSLIWLNMAPLHPQPIGDFLFYFGKYNLYLNL